MPRILVIDDDQPLRETLARVLAGAGYETDQAADGNAGLAACARHRPDLVITDIIMPDREGIETILELRRRSPDLPVIAMSGGSVGHRDYLTAATQLGAVRGLAKPFLPQDLLDAVRDVLDPVPS